MSAEVLTLVSLPSNKCRNSTNKGNNCSDISLKLIVKRDGISFPMSFRAIATKNARTVQIRYLNCVQ